MSVPAWWTHPLTAGDLVVIALVSATLQVALLAVLYWRIRARRTVTRIVHAPFSREAMQSALADMSARHVTFARGWNT